MASPRTFIDKRGRKWYLFDFGIPESYRNLYDWLPRGRDFLYISPKRKRVAL